MLSVMNDLAIAPLSRRCVRGACLLASALLVIAAAGLPAAAQSGPAPYDPERPASPKPEAPQAAPTAAPEQRWGPHDKPDKSPYDGWAFEGPKAGDPAPAPAAAPEGGERPREVGADRRRRYSYEEDPRREKPRKERRRDDDDEDLEDDLPRFGFDVLLWITSYRGKSLAEKDGQGDIFEPGEKPFEFDEGGAGVNFRLFAELSETWRLELEYAVAHFQGSSIMGSTLDFDGRSFTSGDQVEMAVQNELIAFTAEPNIVSFEHFRLSIPFGIGWYSQRVRLTSEITGKSAISRVDAVSPFLGIGFDIPFTKGVGVDARLRFFGFEGGDWDDRIQFGFVDFETNFYVTIGGCVRLSIGYRYLGVENRQRDDFDDSIGDFRLNALTMGVGVVF